MRSLALSISVAALTASAHAKFITTNDKNVFELLSQQGGYSLAAENFNAFSGFYCRSAAAAGQLPGRPTRSAASTSAQVASSAPTTPTPRSP